MQAEDCYLYQKDKNRLKPKMATRDKEGHKRMKKDQLIKR